MKVLHIAESPSTGTPITLQMEVDQLSETDSEPPTRRRSTFAA